MTDIDLDKLAQEMRDGLEGVAVESWRVSYDEIGRGPDVRLVAFLNRDDDFGTGVIDEECAGIDPPSPILEYIASCNPVNIAALLDEREALKRHADAVEKNRDDLVYAYAADKALMEKMAQALVSASSYVVGPEPHATATRGKIRRSIESYEQRKESR